MCETGRTAGWLAGPYSSPHLTFSFSLRQPFSVTLALLKRRASHARLNGQKQGGKVEESMAKVAVADTMTNIYRQWQLPPIKSMLPAQILCA